MTVGASTCLDVHGPTRYGVRVPAPRAPQAQKGRRRPCHRAYDPGRRCQRAWRPGATPRAAHTTDSRRRRAGGSRGEKVKIIRWGAAAAFSAVAALALAAPAAAEDETTPPATTDAPTVLAEHDGLTVTQAACADGGQITISGEGISYHVSSGVRTAGQAARLDGEVYAQTQVEHANGSFTVGEGEELVVPAPEGEGAWTLEFRWFAGPQRDDLPAWKATGPADGEAWDAVVEAIVALQDAEQRHWDARDAGPFVTWYEVEVAGCAPATTAPTTAPATTPAGGESPAPGAGAELPTTGVPPWGLAAAGGALLLAGTGAVLVGRRRRLSLD